MDEELLYTQEDVDEWARTCEELQEKVKEQEETIEQLSEYKRLEEQGLLVRLPCRVGDTLYEVFKDHKPAFIQETTVDKIVLTTKGIRLKLARNSFYETAWK